MADRTSVAHSNTAGLNPRRAASEATTNPAFQAMGFPRLRAKLPSRNWSIFLVIIGSFSGAIIYDRRERRRTQQKWCNAVAHLADAPLDPLRMPRRITIFLEAPPGDSLTSARDHFKEYVKPILVASAIEWDVVEGKKEGDIQHKTAEWIRNKRRETGETPYSQNNVEQDQDIILAVRTRAGVQNSEEGGGDLVIGRHTWKEYVRGVHEGWLGPLNRPVSIDGSVSSSKGSDLPPGTSKSESELPPTNKAAKLSDMEAELPFDSPVMTVSPTQASAAHSPGEEHTIETVAEPAQAIDDVPVTSQISKQDMFLPYIRPNDYMSSVLPASAPSKFDPSLAVGFPHLLGFLNTPVRIWRFLNRRYIAESTGAAVAAFILASDADIRPYMEAYSEASSMSSVGRALSEEDEYSEWSCVLANEERDWHKIAKKANPKGDESRERPWQEPVITDSRLTQRMRTVDVQAISARLRNTSDSGSDSLGVTDLACETVATAAGNVLAGSSGGRDEMQEQKQELRGQRGHDWKGGADRMERVTWVKWLMRLINTNGDAEFKPWQQGFEEERD